jgi:RND family efflux transporter MFP subunit
MLARIHLPEKEAARIEVGQPVVVSPDADLTQEMEGAVSLVAPIVDARTGTIKITCRISGGSGEIRPGSFVRVRLQTDEHEEVLVVPSRALVPEGGETYVYKAVGDTVIKLAVGTGFTEEDYTEITEGLELGERVITVGQGGLRNGTRFRDIQEMKEEAGADSTDDATEAETDSTALETVADR